MKTGAAAALLIGLAAGAQASTITIGDGLAELQEIPNAGDVQGFVGPPLATLSDSSADLYDVPGSANEQDQVDYLNSLRGAPPEPLVVSIGRYNLIEGTDDGEYYEFSTSARYFSFKIGVPGGEASPLKYDEKSGVTIPRKSRWALKS
jgi:hypothetical protein